MKSLKVHLFKSKILQVAKNASKVCTVVLITSKVYECLVHIFDQLLMLMCNARVTL